MSTPTLKVGDRVTRVGAKLLGTVVEVLDVPRPGGVRQVVNVRWPSGFVGICEDRQLVLVERSRSASLQIGDKVIALDEVQLVVLWTALQEHIDNHPGHEDDDARFPRLKTAQALQEQFDAAMAAHLEHA